MTLKPPFKVGDIVVAMANGWGFVPIEITTPLKYEVGKWYYGYTNVELEKFRKITVEDLKTMISRELDTIDYEFARVDKYNEMLKKLENENAK